MSRPYKEESALAAFGFGFRPHGDRQGKKVDEAFGVFRVVAAHGEAGEVRAIERVGRDPLGDVQRALPQFQPDRSGDALLRHVEKSVERLAQWREPQAVVNEFRIAYRKGLLEVRGLPVNGQPL